MTMVRTFEVLYFLLPVLFCVSFATEPSQIPDQAYLKSLPHLHGDLLNDLACDNIEKREDVSDCYLILETDKNGVLTDENLAWRWLKAVNEIEIEESYQGALATWNYETNMTDYNQHVKSNVSYLKAVWGTQVKKQARRFKWKTFEDPKLRRVFNFMLRGGKLDGSEQREENEEEDLEISRRLDHISTQMIDIYGKGTVCRPKGEKYPSKASKNKEQECLTLEPDLQDILVKSHDYDELLWVWKGWHNNVGREIGKLYPEWVSLKNIAAKNGGYDDEGQLWRELYEIPNDGLEEMVDALYEKVKPMYMQLHAFVRKRLVEQYPGKVNPRGPVPAHLFGNMWAQQWNNIYDIVKPFKDVDKVDVTAEMVKQNYNQTYMFHVAEKFFKSIGMDPMPENFWKYSMMMKPEDREAVCHGSAHNFMKNREVRIKMCTEVDMEDLYTIHHEMGHCEYYLQYDDQPVIFRSGANPGFHEAVGDTIALSVVTPDYLHKIGLMDTIERSYEATINYQMEIALSKIAFLPFGLMIDKWRWQVFRENIAVEDYNKKWWEYRLKYEGIVPPVARDNPEDFDPGAKYHIPSGTPYIRYFISFLLQFQFQRALCKEAGYTGPLHQCNIYQSTKAGDKLKEMLSLGMSQPWTETLKVLTGQDYIDVTAIEEYFAPLLEWLKTENGDDVGWEPVPEEGEDIDDSLELLLKELLEEDYRYMDAKYKKRDWQWY